MAIAFDNANSVKGTAVANLTTGAWTIAGSDRVLIAGMGWSDGTPATYTSIKWGGSGGTALTQIGSTLASGSFHRVAVARLIAPTAASQTLYGEVSAAQGEFCLGGVSFTGVHQTTPVGTEATATGSGTGTTFTATVDVSSAADEVVIDMAYGGSTSNAGTQTIAVGAGQTMRWEQESIGTFQAGTQSTEPGAASVTMSEDYTITSSAYAWGIIGVGIKPAPPPSTTLYLRNTKVNDLGATYYDMLTTAGSASDTAVVNATLAGTEIQFTKTAGGAIAQWVSGKVPAGGFTLTSADLSIWAKEDADLTNAGGRFRLFRREADGTETELAGGPFDDGVEFTTTDAEYTWSGDATDTAFIEGDRVLLKLYITNIGVMAIGTATLTFNAADAATGDSFLNIFPAVVFGGGNFSGGSFSGAEGGFSVDTVAGDGQGLFWPANLDGIGTGGPFLGHSVH